MDIVPSGFHFLPTDEEIIKHYLVKISRSEELPSRMVVKKDIYQEDARPWTIFRENIDPWLPHENSKKKRILYVYTTLTLVSDHKESGGCNVKRKNRYGTWQIQNGRDIKDGLNNLIGQVKSLTYKPEKNLLDMETMKKRYGSWSMYEYTLAGELYGTSPYAVCKIIMNSSDIQEAEQHVQQPPEERSLLYNVNNKRYRDFGRTAIAAASLNSNKKRVYGGGESSSSNRDPYPVDVQVQVQEQRREGEENYNHQQLNNENYLGGMGSGGGILLDGQDLKKEGGGVGPAANEILIHDPPTAYVPLLAPEEDYSLVIPNDAGQDVAVGHELIISNVEAAVAAESRQEEEEIIRNVASHQVLSDDVLALLQNINWKLIEYEGTTWSP